MRYIKLFAVGPAILATLAGAGPAEAQTGFVKESPADLAGYNVYRPADLAARKGPVPVIAWANGGCVKRDKTWASLFERWAGAGYVVITISDPALDNVTAPSPRPAAPPPGTAPAAPAMAQVSAQARATADAQGKAIDWAEKANRAGAYAGKLDLGRVVAAGNSCGGISSLDLASRDKRPRAIFVLSGSSAGPAAKPETVAGIMGKVAVPAIWIVGGTEDIAHRAAAMDYDALPAGVPAVVVERNAGDHRTVSTDPAILEDVAEIGLAWFPAALNRDKAAIGIVTTRGCPSCAAPTWTVRAKNF